MRGNFSAAASQHEQEVISFHEASHAMVAEALPHVDRVHRISIIPRGIVALGYTLQLPTEGHSP
jgi:cell division protease FtsH